MLHLLYYCRIKLTQDIFLRLAAPGAWDLSEITEVIRFQNDTYTLHIRDFEIETIIRRRSVHTPEPGRPEDGRKITTPGV